MIPLIISGKLQLIDTPAPAPNPSHQGQGAAR
jgi:hypothetical protein